MQQNPYTETPSSGLPSYMRVPYRPPGPKQGLSQQQSQQPFRHSYTPPSYAPKAYARPASHYIPSSHQRQYPAAAADFDAFSNPAPKPSPFSKPRYHPEYQQTASQLTPRTDQKYKPYRPPSLSIGQIYQALIPPSPYSQPADDSENDGSEIYSRSQTPQTHSIAHLKREEDGSTLWLLGPDGTTPLYRCKTTTEQSSLSSTTNYVMHHVPSDTRIGSARRWRVYWAKSDMLDHFEVRGKQEGAGLYRWKAATQANGTTDPDGGVQQWKCYRLPHEADDLMLGRRYFADIGSVVAEVTFDWTTNTGRVDFCDGELLANPERRPEIDEFFVTAVVAIDVEASKTVEEMEDAASLGDLESLIAGLESLAARTVPSGDGDGRDLWS